MSIPGTNTPDVSLISGSNAKARVVNFAKQKPIVAPTLDSSASSKIQPWQKVAYDHNDCIPEVAAAHMMMSNLFARGTLRVMEISQDSDRGGFNLMPTKNQDAVMIIESLASQYGTLAPVLYQFAHNLFIAGDCYLLGIPRRGPGRKKKFNWEVVSVLELRRETDYRGTKLYRMNPNATDGREELPEGSVYYRCFRPDPRLSKTADSAMKHNQDLCQEILLLSALINTIAMSRMNAGVWCIPDELSFDADDETDTPDGSDGASLDPLSAAYFTHMSKRIENPRDPSALLALLIRGPKEFLPGKDSYIRFDREFDDTLLRLREDGLLRLFRGLDLPVENVMGRGGAASWSAFAIEQDTIAKHIQPMGNVVANFLTAKILRPFLLENGFADEDTVDKFVVEYDASEIATKPDLTKTALELHAKYVISDEALRRLSGIDESDAPSDEERKERIAIDKSALSSELAQVLLPIVPGFEDVDLVPAVPVSGNGPQGADSKAVPGKGPGVDTTRSEIPSGANARPKKRAGKPVPPGPSPADSAGAD